MTPLGSEINLGFQIVALILIFLGLRYAIKTHNVLKSPNPVDPKSENIHKNLMTIAVVFSGLGAIIWMIPNFFLGWFYGQNALGYGSGGYLSYFEFGGLYPHWYLIVLMVALGSITSILGVYLVLRMRLRSFPKSLAIKNFRGLMIATWILWFLNLVLGFVVFYFFAFLQTG